MTREFLLRTGHQVDAQTVAELAAQGEPHARATLDLYAGRLARALATVINIVDPEVIVLGGGLSNLAVLYDEVPRRWGRWAFVGRHGPTASGAAPPDAPLLTRLAPARWGDSSGVRGAARLVAG